jgi:hypothetical protein
VVPEAGLEPAQSELRGILSPKVSKLTQFYKPLILRIHSLSSRAFSFSTDWLELGRVGWEYGLTVTKWLQLKTRFSGPLFLMSSS